MEAIHNWLGAIAVNYGSELTVTMLIYTCQCLTRGEDSCTKAKPLFWPVCLSLIRRMLLDERLAYGARAVKMASTVVRAAIFLRMIAVEDKCLYLRRVYEG